MRYVPLTRLDEAKAATPDLVADYWKRRARAEKLAKRRAKAFVFVTWLALALLALGALHAIGGGL